MPFVIRTYERRPSPEDATKTYFRHHQSEKGDTKKVAVPFFLMITYMEMVQGMRNKKELNSLRKSIHVWNAKLLYISEEISSKAMFYVEERFLSHSLELAAALIAATAIAYGLPILTGNSKHYSIIKDIQVKSFHP